MPEHKSRSSLPFLSPSFLINHLYVSLISPDCFKFKAWCLLYRPIWETSDVAFVFFAAMERRAASWICLFWCQNDMLDRQARLFCHSVAQFCCRCVTFLLCVPLNYPSTTLVGAFNRIAQVQSCRLHQLSSKLYACGAFRGKTKPTSHRQRMNVSSKFV